jgi:flagellar biogenesis protein FliO
MELSQLFQVILSFAAVIALMLGLSFLIRRFGLEKRWQTARSSSGGMQLTDSMFLDARRRMVVVQVEQKRYLLLLDAERAQVVDTLSGGNL